MSISVPGETWDSAPKQRLFSELGVTGQTLCNNRSFPWPSMLRIVLFILLHIFKFLIKLVFLESVFSIVFSSSARIVIGLSCVISTSKLIDKS